jgi:hypothetical protein
MTNDIPLNDFFFKMVRLNATKDKFEDRRKRMKDAWTCPLRGTMRRVDHRWNALIYYKSWSISPSYGLSY